MDIGTAKPSAADRERVPHHLIDVLDPWESASVAWWLERAAAACADIERRGKPALFVGGTPFYLKALLCGLFDVAAGRRTTCAGDWKRRPSATAGRHCTPGWRRSTRRPPAAAPERRPPGRPGPGGLAPDRQADQRLAAAVLVGRRHPAVPAGFLPGGRCAAGRTVRPHRPPGGGDVRRRLGRGGPPAAGTAAAARAGRRRRRSATGRSGEFLDGAAVAGGHGRRDPGADPAVRQAAAHLVPGPAGCRVRGREIDFRRGGRTE